MPDSVSITFLDDNDPETFFDDIDTLKVVGDVDYVLSDTKLTAGTKNFSLLETSVDTPSFNNADISGGTSNNKLTLDDWSGSFIFGGAGGSDTLQANNFENRWEIDGTNSGTLNGNSFSGVEYLTGGSNVDRFNLRNGGSLSGQIDGGDGSDMLIGPDVDSEWRLTGSDEGTLVGVTTFAAIENLSGGTAADRFVVLADGSLSGDLDGGLFLVDAPADNSLDFSLLSGPVTVDLGLVNATGIYSFSRIDKAARAPTTCSPVRALRAMWWNGPSQARTLAGLGAQTSVVLRT